MSYAAFPGTLYDMRDIDCIDQSLSPVRETGVTPNAIQNLARSAQGRPPVAPCV